MQTTEETVFNSLQLDIGGRNMTLRYIDFSQCQPEKIIKAKTRDGMLVMGVSDLE